jgi:hypothetical protein
VLLEKNSLPPLNWRWVEEGEPLGVGLPSGLQCLVPYPYRAVSYTVITVMMLTGLADGAGG